MKRRLVLSFFFCIAVALLSPQAFASNIFFSDDFSGPDGNLVGTTPDIGQTWAQTAPSNLNVVQVTSGKVLLKSTGQDVDADFQSLLPHTDGSVIHTSMDINLSAVGTGDYFTLLADSTFLIFPQRLGAAATSGGYFLTLAETIGGGATTLVGTTVLNLDTTYHVDINWTVVPGPSNDTFQVLVDNASYLNKTWTSTNPEPAFLQYVFLRQGNAASSPTLSVDNLMVETVPEPSTLLLLGIGAISLLGYRKAKSHG